MGERERNVRKKGGKGIRSAKRRDKEGKGNRRMRREILEK